LVPSFRKWKNGVDGCFSPLYNPFMSNSKNAPPLTTKLTYILHNSLPLINRIISPQAPRIFSWVKIPLLIKSGVLQLENSYCHWVLDFFYFQFMPFSF
jgi:hypothetical protein